MILVDAVEVILTRACVSMLVLELVLKLSATMTLLALYAFLELEGSMSEVATSGKLDEASNGTVEVEVSIGILQLSPKLALADVLGIEVFKEEDSP